MANKRTEVGKKLMSALAAIAFTLTAAAGASAVITVAEEVNIPEGQTTGQEGTTGAKLVETVTADVTGFTEETVDIVLPDETATEYESEGKDTDNTKALKALAKIRLAEAELTIPNATYVNVGNATGDVCSSVSFPYSNTQYANTERTLWDFFKSLGFTDAGAAAAMGNLSMESGLNPGSKSENFDYLNQKGGAGLAGWMSAGRFRGLMSLAEANQASWQDLSIQMAYLQYELENTRKTVGEEMKTQTDVDYATDYFCVYFEGCIGRSASPSIDGISVINGEWYQGLAKRKALARMYFERYSG